MLWPNLFVMVIPDWVHLFHQYQLFPDRVHLFHPFQHIRQKIVFLHIPFQLFFLDTSQYLLNVGKMGSSVVSLLQLLSKNELVKLSILPFLKQCASQLHLHSRFCGLLRDQILPLKFLYFHNNSSLYENLRVLTQWTCFLHILSH